MSGTVYNLVTEPGQDSRTLDSSSLPGLPHGISKQCDIVTKGLNLGARDQGSKPADKNWMLLLVLRSWTYCSTSGSSLQNENNAHLTELF